MFTGIIETVATICGRGDDWLEVELSSPDALDAFKVGESIAINGCCLTLIGTNPCRFDISAETWRRTSLGGLTVGSAVNFERAMPANGRFGGHIVQGHVDATGTIQSIAGASEEREFAVLTVSGPADYDRYLIDKGSVAVDGISLTVVNPSQGTFEVWLIPHTIANTNLRDKKAGDAVNLEYDLVAKYVEKLQASR